MSRRGAVLLAGVGLLLLSLVPARGASPPAAGSQAAPGALTAREPTTPATKVIAYYFHVNARCQTCLLIEQRSHDVITGGFAREFEAGSLEWRVVNTQRPENRSVLTELKLPSRGLILLEYRAGTPGRWQNLDGVWERVHGSEAEFSAYVSGSVRAFVDGGH
jgi:hypothetical protein